MTEDYKIKSVTDEDILKLPSYLRLNSDMRQRLNKTLFNIGSKMDSLKVSTVSKSDLLSSDKVYLMHLSKLGRIELCDDDRIKIIN